MARRWCALLRISSNGGGLSVQMRETSADARGSHEELPLTQSADLPVSPYGAEPAGPAYATGASPDAPAAAPARTLLGVAAIVALCTAVPGAAAKCFDARHRAQVCRAKAGDVVVKAPAKKVAGPTTVVLKGAGGGGFAHWTPIAADLMP